MSLWGLLILFPLPLTLLNSIPACTEVHADDRADKKCLWNNECKNYQDKSRIRCLLNWELKNFSAVRDFHWMLNIARSLIHFVFLCLGWSISICIQRRGGCQANGAMSQLPFIFHLFRFWYCCSSEWLLTTSHPKWSNRFHCRFLPPDTDKQRSNCL